MSAKLPFTSFVRALPLAALLAVLVLGAPAATAQADPPAQARQALNEGRFAEAVSILNLGLAQDPDHVEMLVLRGQAHEARRQFGEAARDYERALRIRPGLAAAQSGLERAQRHAGAASGGSLDSYRRQMQADPTNLTYRLQYADALRDAGRPGDAVEQYQWYLERTQGTPDVVTRYLVALAGTGQHARGASEAARYLNLYPSSADLWMRLGYFRLWQGQFDAAEDAFRQSLAADPRHQEARRGLQEATAGARTRRDAPAPRTAAVERLQAQVQSQPDRADLRFELIDELDRLGRHVEAFSELQALEPAHGESPRWRERFQRVDRALPEDAEVFRIDRLTYRLALDPSDMRTRYAAVDALAEADRYAEALATLTAGGRFAGSGDAAYQARLQQLQDARLAHARRQQDAMSGRLARDPADREAARHLAATLPVLHANDELDTDLDEAIALYERLLADRPADAEVRFQYAQLLTQSRQPGAAVEQSRRLLEIDPDDPRYVAQYVYAAIQQSPPPADTERVLQRGLRNHPNDQGLLLAAVTYYTSTAYEQPENLDAAERYLQQAEAVGADLRDVAARRQTIQAARDYRLLTAARDAASRGRYQEAIRGIESYHRVSGAPMTRDARLELAQYHAAAGDRAAAIRLLEEAQQEEFTTDAQLAIARFRFDGRDYRGTLRALEPVLARQPGQPQALILQGDAYRELERYDDAEAAYRIVLNDFDAGARRDAEARLAFLDQISGFGTGFGVLVVPHVDIVWAGGDGLEYRRIAPGLDVQVTVPAPTPVTVTAGYQAHRISGTDLVLPELAQDVPPYTAHQLGGGVIVDITPRVRTLSYTENYTNRFIGEAGVFHYPSFTNALTGQPDSRTAPFWSARFMHQNPGQYRIGVGVRQTEGSEALWAPIGPSIGLTLLQADIRAAATPLDSLLKVEAGVAYNHVRHDGVEFAFAQFDRFTGETVTNNGLTADLKVGYRLAQGLYLGGMYHRIQYDQPSPFYYAPADQPYELYEAFLEYETPAGGQRPYLRVLGAVGTVAYSGGYVSRRIEADLIYPIQQSLGLGLNLRAGQSARAFADGDFSSYSILVFSGSLYIGL